MPARLANAGDARKKIVPPGTQLGCPESPGHQLCRNEFMVDGPFNAALSLSTGRLSKLCASFAADKLHPPLRLWQLCLRPAGRLHREFLPVCSASQRSSTSFLPLFFCPPQDTHNFSIVEHGSAKGRCPYCPRQRSTALVSGQSASPHDVMKHPQDPGGRFTLQSNYASLPAQTLC